MSTNADQDPIAGSHPESDYKEDAPSDQVPVENDAPLEEADPDVADSNQQLQQDENDAIDKSNIVGSRTRQTGPQGGYQEPGDDEV